MDTQKTLEKINSSKVDPSIERKILEAKRRSTSLDLIREFTKKYPIPALTDTVPVAYMRQLFATQAIMMSAGIYVSIDWNKNEYFCIDLQLGKEIRDEEKKN